MTFARNQLTVILMKSERFVNSALTLPKPLLKDAVTKATKIHGKRGFSRYVRQLISADLAKPAP